MATVRARGEVHIVGAVVRFRGEGEQPLRCPLRGAHFFWSSRRQKQNARAQGMGPTSFCSSESRSILACAAVIG